MRVIECANTSGHKEQIVAADEDAAKEIFVEMGKAKGVKNVKSKDISLDLLNDPSCTGAKRFSLLAAINGSVEGVLSQEGAEEYDVTALHEPEDGEPVPLEEAVDGDSATS